MTAMKRLRKGFLDTRIDHGPGSGEFFLMYETFNGMASQIQELKINIYEEEISRRQAEFKHLQLQINPHFFLNSLNIVYYLAQSKDYELIQDMSLCLIHYFRYMFRSNSDRVPLVDEISHTRNYLRIQQLRLPENLTYQIDVQGNADKHSVPQLVIQSFAENAIKHAVSLDHLIHIQITVACNLEGLLVRISDNGNGFRDEILEMLEAQQERPGAEGKHIGIWNVKRRLQMIYNGKAHIRFANAESGGAVVEIMLPQQEPEQEGMMKHV